MYIKCPKCNNTNFCISQDTIDGVEYNVISCVIDDYIIGAYPPATDNGPNIAPVNNVLT